MSDAPKKPRSIIPLVLIIVVALVDLALLLRKMLIGKNIALFETKGTIALEQRNLAFFTVGIMLIIAIPVFSALYFIAWKYRDSNTKSLRSVSPHKPKHVAVFLWIAPLTIMIILATHMAGATQKLNPRKTVSSGVKPLIIQVISLRWKWLFLYPEQGVASVNYVQIPVNRPVEFDLTADETPMSSFWIPNLGGQLYSMTSHENRLNLLATDLGDFPGRNAEINGEGFAGMQFTVRASTNNDFDNWVQSTKNVPKSLDPGTYQKLLQPSQDNPKTLYANYDSSLYTKVLDKYQQSVTNQVSGT